MSDEGVNGVKSADRVLDLFDLLGRWGSGMSHSEIAARLGIPKSSLSQLLKNLVARDYVAFSAEDKSYRIGGRFAALAYQTGQLRDLISLAQPVVAEVNEATNESAAINVLDGDMARVAVAVNSSQRLVSHMRLGDLAPLYATSGGKAILAFLPEAMREEYLAKVKFEAITPRTISSVAELRRQIKRCQQEHVAESLEEFTVGIVGIAVPVLSQSQHALGSLNVAIPAVRCSAKALELALEALKHAANTLHAQLAGSA